VQAISTIGVPLAMSPYGEPPFVEPEWLERCGITPRSGVALPDKRAPLARSIFSGERVVTTTFTGWGLGGDDASPAMLVAKRVTRDGWRLPQLYANKDPGGSADAAERRFRCLELSIMAHRRVSLERRPTG
jgi:hypothetical protein